jgi:hypothetical protein
VVHCSAAAREAVPERACDTRRTVAEMIIRPGDRFRDDRQRPGSRMRAIGPPQAGKDFPVVWLCTERDFRRAQDGGEEPEGVPWPLDAVRVS